MSDLRIAEYKKMGTEMVLHYRDATPEEIEEFDRQNAKIKEQEPSTDERLTIMEDAFAELCEVICNG